MRWKPLLSSAAALSLLMLGGCATVNALSSAPPEFWGTLEELMLAIWSDLLSVVDLVL